LKLNFEIQSLRGVKYEKVNENAAQGVANLMSDNLNEEMSHMSGRSKDITRLYALA
jgi:hypothetical protein